MLRVGLCSRPASTFQLLRHTWNPSNIPYRPLHACALNRVCTSKFSVWFPSSHLHASVPTVNFARYSASGAQDVSDGNGKPAPSSSSSSSWWRRPGFLSLSYKDNHQTHIDWKKVRSFAWAEKRPIGLGLCALLLSAGVDLYFPKALGEVVDLVSNKCSDVSMLAEPIASLAGVLLVGFIGSCSRAYCLGLASEGITRRIRTELFSRIMNQTVSFFDKTRTGELLSRLGVDTTYLSKSLTVELPSGIKSVVVIVGGFSMMFSLSPPLAGLAGAVVPAIGWGTREYGRYRKRLSKEMQAELARATAIAEEKISNIRTVKIFNGEQREVGSYVQYLDRTFDLGKKTALARAVYDAGVFLAVNLSLLGILFVGGRLVLAGSISVGTLTAFITYSYFVGTACRDLSGVVGEIMRAVGASERIFQILSLPNDVTVKPAAATVYEPPRTVNILPYNASLVQAGIEFDDVYFRYAGRPEVPVLQGLSMELKSGSVVALVGPSGCGKSTIGALLTRLYEPDQGRILLNGCDISVLDVHWLRNQIGVVSQEPVLFAATVAENIRYGKPDATAEEIRLAADTANADGFIRGFPDGYNTYVGERGVSLSGGQKQRVAIARALLKNPRILLLDEATSALDTESERLVQQALERLLTGRTSLVISHRFSTIEHAHAVAVIQNGRVAEYGTVGQLSADPSSLFTKLLQSQQRSV
eukprot:GILK01006698.1.p1 GENE.GILK01006698.1~~GILK01006698.1.p1  ORF type:complete len:700 (-),score=110.28 GILK01006698.1:58-2157(-)